MASAGGYNKAVDTQFVPASVSAGSPSAITLESAATKRVAVSNQSAAAAPQQQTQAAPAKMAAASPQQQKPKGRRLTATKPSGGCDANIKVCNGDSLFYNLPLVFASRDHSTIPTSICSAGDQLRQ